MYNPVPIMPPWGGWKDDLPSIALPNNSFKQITNWLLNKGRITSFPQITPYLATPDNRQILGAKSYQDLYGYAHTVVLTQNGVFALTPGPVYVPLVFSGPGTPFPNLNFNFAMEVFNNKVFWANGNNAILYTDGSAGYFLAGNSLSSCFFMGKLASRLLLANCFELNTATGLVQNFPGRVRWSGINNGLVWSGNDAVGLTAGALDIPEVEDGISGVAVLGRNGFIFRLHGITVLSPTGNFIAPFDVENFSNGPKGVGVFIPYTLANYGQFCSFVSEEDIYMFDGANMNNIGGSAKRSIYKDLDQRTALPTGTAFGSLDTGVDFLSYWLAIPQSNGGSLDTVLWIYHYDTQTWVRETFTGIGRISLMERLTTA